MDKITPTRSENPQDGLGTVFHKEPFMVSRRVADEVILVPVRRKAGEVECLYTVNEVGGRIWDLINGQRSLKQVRDAIVEEFAVSEHEAQEDLITLIEQLQEIGAIQQAV